MRLLRRNLSLQTESDTELEVVNLLFYNLYKSFMYYVLIDSVNIALHTFKIFSHEVLKFFFE